MEGRVWNPLGCQVTLGGSGLPGHFGGIGNPLGCQVTLGSLWGSLWGHFGGQFWAGQFWVQFCTQTRFQFLHISNRTAVLSDRYHTEPEANREDGEDNRSKDERQSIYFRKELEIGSVFVR